MTPAADFVVIAGLAGTAAICLAVALDGLTRRGGLVGMRLAVSVIAACAGMASLCLLGVSQQGDPADAIRWHVGQRVALGFLAAGVVGAVAGLLKWPPGRTLPLALTTGVVLAGAGAYIAMQMTPQDLVLTAISWFPTHMGVRLFDALVISGASAAMVCAAVLRLRAGVRYGRREMKLLIGTQLVVAVAYAGVRLFAPPTVMQAFGVSLTGISALFFWALLRGWRATGVGTEAFHLLFQTLSLPAVAVDLHTDATLLNPSAAALLGDVRTPEGVVKRLGLGALGPSAEVWLRAHAGRRIDEVRIDDAPDRQFELLVQHDAEEAIGLLLLMDVTERAEHARSLSRTLSELRQMQERMVMSEKMAALGVLVSGVSHEINNPLAYASSNLGISLQLVEALLEGIPLSRQVDSNAPGAAALHAWAERREVRLAEDDLLAALREAEDGCTRIREIVASMRLLSRQSDVDAPVDLADVVQAGVRIGKTSLSPSVELKVELSTALPIRGSAGEISRLLTNLLVNAGQAMGAEGQVTVRAWREGSEAVVEVDDTGPGIPPELRARIFEPFFTTKAPGVGTGLGLAISYETARRHEGHLLLLEKEGRGARFQLRLPLRADEASAG